MNHDFLNLSKADQYSWILSPKLGIVCKKYVFEIFFDGNNNNNNHNHNHNHNDNHNAIIVLQHIALIFDNMQALYLTNSLPMTPLLAASGFPSCGANWAPTSCK